MRNYQDKPMRSIIELHTLTPYHWARSRDAMRGVEEMSKHPLSDIQFKEQVRRNKEIRQNNVMNRNWV
ncbi:MAG: hypothetical protein LBR84_01990 [Tannerella sp.]|nr:hypothetical protein [Tannerella sp.]